MVDSRHFISHFQFRKKNALKPIMNKVFFLEFFKEILDSFTFARLSHKSVSTNAFVIRAMAMTYTSIVTRIGMAAVKN